MSNLWLFWVTRQAEECFSACTIFSIHKTYVCLINMHHTLPLINTKMQLISSFFIRFTILHLSDQYADMYTFAKLLYNIMHELYIYLNVIQDIFKLLQLVGQSD